MSPSHIHIEMLIGLISADLVQVTMDSRWILSSHYKTKDDPKDKVKIKTKVLMQY